MESVDGARSVQAASDEIRDQCDPCNYEGNKKTAVNFCQECKEYLCKDCTDSHTKFTMSRNHRITSADQVLGQSSIASTSCKILCESCKSEEVKIYCEKHHIVTCQPCNSIKHRKCKSIPINEKGKSYDVAKCGRTTETLKSLSARLDQFLKDKTTDLETLRESKKTCISEIKTFRQEINEYLDILEEMIINELENKESQERNEIELHLSTVSVTKEMLKTEFRLLEDTKKTSMNCNMFAADVKVSNSLKEYENLLKDIYKESKSPVITFKRNNQLDGIKSKTSEFGTLAVNNLPNRRFEHKLFPDMSVKSCNQVDVKLKDDINAPYISGCDVLPDGQIILCDDSNNKVKLLHSSFTLTESLKLRCKPFDVSVINNSCAIVTLPESKQLQYIELEPSLKCGRVIQLDKKCWGVQVVGVSLYITLHNNPGQGEVRILGLKGNLKKRIVNQDGSFKFGCPYKLTVSSASGRIYSSNSVTATVSCIKPDGSVINQYQDNNLKRPRGLCVDAMENLIVCDVSSNSVQIITASGKLFRSLLTADDGVKWPLGIAYRHTDNTLIIGNCGGNNVLVCHLKQEGNQ